MAVDDAERVSAAVDRSDACGAAERARSAHPTSRPHCARGLGLPLVRVVAAALGRRTIVGALVLPFGALRLTLRLGSERPAGAERATLPGFPGTRARAHLDIREIRGAAAGARLARSTAPDVHFARRAERVARLAARAFLRLVEPATVDALAVNGTAHAFARSLLALGCAESERATVEHADLRANALARDVRQRAACVALPQGAGGRADPDRDPTRHEAMRDPVPTRGVDARRPRLAEVLAHRHAVRRRAVLGIAGAATRCSPCAIGLARLVTEVAAASRCARDAAVRVETVARVVGPLASV